MIVILPLNIFLQTVCYFFFCNSKCVLPTTQKEAKYITLHRISKNSNRMYCQWVMAYICKGSEFLAKKRKDSEPHLEELLCCWKLICLLPFSPSLHWGNKTREHHGQTTHIQISRFVFLVPGCAPVVDWIALLPPPPHPNSYVEAVIPSIM